ncbi:CsiV family protein [Alcanivorax sp.]|uniref:CsiV family protein n=1 Tax=Alcanivorax sp. TaxID=1872427 RepID=UPI0025BA0A48|nr:CsiV family protein [Alcanivorax sp.]
MRRALLLIILACLANPAFAGWYKVEVLVFARNHPVSDEIWNTGLQPRYASQSVTIGAPEQSEYVASSEVARGAWMPISEEQTSLQYMMERMESTGDYRQLYHAGWRQTISNKGDTTPVYIRGGQTILTDEGEVPELEGTLHFSESRFVHVSPRLWLNTESSGERFYVDISEGRRLTGSDVYYFDHPMFGMVVRVTR